VISSSGNSNGILWALDGSSKASACVAGSTCLGLWAYDATNLGILLYNSGQAPNNRDSSGSAVKFEVPIIVNGKVYAGGVDSVTAYGLLGTTNATATPVQSPAAGAYLSGQTVTIADATAGAAIYYTQNGTTPTAASTPYTGPIELTATTLLQSIAVAGAANASGIASSLYTITKQPAAAAPILSPAAGTYATAQAVTLSDNTQGAKIYYTTNGATPTTASTVYSGPISVGAPTTIEAIAVATGFATSAVTKGVYTIGAEGPAPVSVSLAAVANLYGLADSGTAVTGGGADGHGDAFAANLLGNSVTWGTTTFSLAAAGPGSAATNTTIPLPHGSYTALSLLGSGVNGGAAGQVLTVTYTDGTTTNFTQSFSDWFTPKKYTGESIVATTAYRVRSTGATQAGPVYLYGYSFPLDAAKTVSSVKLPDNVNVVVVGIDLTPVANEGATAAPSLSPPPGTYASAQSVTLADATPGAVIYYTTDGSTPTTASSAYAAPVRVTATTTLNAIAVATGYTESAIASGIYTIESQSTTPLSVSLQGIANLYGLADEGTAVTGGGADGHGDAFAANLLGGSVTWGSTVFSLAAAGPGSAVTNKVVPLPLGSDAAISLLASGVNGGQLNQVFVVTYTDGTTASFTQSLSDWYTPKKYAGETTLATMAYRVKSTGASQAGPVYLYGYSFALDATKTVASLTLPSNANVVIAAIDLTP
jgi:hypothetical protein